MICLTHQIRSLVQFYEKACPTRTWPEVLAAISIIAPSVVAIAAMSQENPHPSIQIAGIGCLLHCPLSMTLHFHRAFGTDPGIRTLLYKLDVSFIHLHSVLQSISWNLKVQPPNLLFHGAAVIWIWTAPPTPANKRRTDILTAAGVVLSSANLAGRSLPLFIIALLGWATGFAIYSAKWGGEAQSSILFHLLLGIPQYCLMRGVAIHAQIQR